MQEHRRSTSIFLSVIIVFIITYTIFSGFLLEKISDVLQRPGPIYELLISPPVGPFFLIGFIGIMGILAIIFTGVFCFRENWILTFLSTGIQVAMVIGIIIAYKLITLDHPIEEYHLLIFSYMEVLLKFGLIISSVLGAIIVILTVKSIVEHKQIKKLIKKLSRKGTPTEKQA